MAICIIDSSMLKRKNRNANDLNVDTQGSDEIASATAHTIKVAHVLAQTNDTEHGAPQCHKDTTPMALLPDQSCMKLMWITAGMCACAYATSSPAMEAHAAVVRSTLT